MLLARNFERSVHASLLELGIDNHLLGLAIEALTSSAAAAYAGAHHSLKQLPACLLNALALTAELLNCGLCVTA
jgi:hypothetical protein